MAVGQGVLGDAVLDVAAVNLLSGRIEARETCRSVQHAEQLADCLALSRVWADAGMSLGTEAHLALVLSCSEARASSLLCDARMLSRLGALEAMREGLLTVEQARVVVDLLGTAADALGALLWERLAGRLEADRAQGMVRPPARLRELLSRWLIAADAEAWAARRSAATQADADVELWKRPDGTVDLVGRALSAADAIACSDRIDALAQPVGPDDERTTGQRRQAALVDLLLGRAALPFGATGEGDAGGSRGCCPAGSPAPRGAQVFVHVPIGSAAAERTEPAQLVGHDPIDAALLTDLLAAAPVLRRVWVDADSGVPVAVDDRTWTPGSDPALLKQTLALMRAGPPPDVRHPTHRADHLPGPYVPPRRLKKLLRARAPRCEWPGCGRCSSRAAGRPCDHDLAWPYGPTCACNLGPLCRRHHRIKQQGWSKQRPANCDVRWTDPTGRTWASPSQHRSLQLTRPARRRRQVAPGVWALAA